MSVFNKSFIIECLLSIPKSVFVSAKLFGLKKAFRLPVVVRYNTKVLSVKGNATMLGGVEFG